jgi:hypothetical protein
VEKNKIILLGVRGHIKYHKISRIFLLTVSILVIALAISNLLFFSRSSIPSLVMLAYGAAFLFYGTIFYDKKSTLSPKVVVDTKQLSIKNSLFKKPFIYKWEDIDYITLGTNEVTIHYSTKSNTIYFKTSSNSSEAAKKVIEQQALQQKIPITGG